MLRGKHNCVNDLDQYCSEEVTRVIISRLDEPDDTDLQNYTIPRALARYDDEIMEVYCGWEPMDHDDEMISTLS